ncbi:MarR family transcriptional regulator [Microbacterium sp.]|jgi:DNA-binding MarR family transcriptional regulator|uniref:MarR family transcriptional regulator n=1 Tax=Microbacterium sp. TaxID=51671 RepID=UPI0037C99272
MTEHDSATTADQALQRFTDARNAAMIAARKELGVNEVDARALLFIAANPGARPTHLRDHLGITSAGITTMIDRLAGRGVVRRDVDDDDRRVNRISLAVDLSAEPWSALTRFDTRLAEAAEAMGMDESHRFGVALDELVAAAR